MKDPRSPYHRRQAFDLGEAGAGTTANSLHLGCDCLGAIKYFSFNLSDSKGNPTQAKNVICLHEQVSQATVTPSILLAKYMLYNE